MIRKAIDTLSAKLSDGLSLSNSRLETLCLPVIGIASVRTVNLSHICGEMPTQAKVESTYRRLQRFFQHVSLGKDWSAPPVVRRSKDQGFQPGRHPSLDRRKVELVGRSPCPGHGMGCKGGIHQARNTETASKVSWAIRKIHLPHPPGRNRKALANPAGTSLPTLAQNQAENQAENRMSRVQGSRP